MRTLNKIKMQLRTLAIAGLATISLATSCNKDKDPVPVPPPVVNEPETITTIKLMFTDSSGATSPVTATFNDPDGDGGNPPTQKDTIRLLANKTYYTRIVLLDVTKSPVDTISNAVEEEANDHMFFFHTTGGNLTISYDDLDTNNPPLHLGLKTLWRTAAAGNGSVRVILKHQAGVKNGTETPGETDVDVTFPMKIQ